MFGTVVNAVAIVMGGIVGVLVKHGLKEKYKKTIMQGLGMTVILIGLMNALEAKNLLLVILSIVIGSIIGEWLEIEEKLGSFGDWAQSHLGGGGSTFSKGFVTASLLYCVGAMAITGALNSGLTGNHEILYAKSVIDGITAIVFASTLGIGVAFSAVPVFLYQGLITLTASGMGTFLTEAVKSDMSSVGGLLIIGIAFNILEIKKIKVGNMLPAIFIPLVYYMLTLLYNIIF